MIGSPDTRSLGSDFYTDTGDVKYPILVVSRPDGGGFKFINERNIPVTDSSRVSIRRFVKDRYINSDENNINLEIYRYDPPRFFECEYAVSLFCEYGEHVSEFQSQFLERLDQMFVPIKSERFRSMYFSVV